MQSTFSKWLAGSSPIARPGHLPDIARCPGYGQCPEYGQFSLSIFRTSTFDVRDMASKNWPYPGHQNSMSGMWPVKTGHIPDIKNRCQGYGQLKLSMSQTSIFDVRNMDREYCPCPGHQLLMSGIWTEKIVHLPDITSNSCPYSGHHCPYSRHHCPYSGHHCPYSRHHFFLTVHVPDIKSWCPEYGQ